MDEPQSNTVQSGENIQDSNKEKSGTSKTGIIIAVLVFLVLLGLLVWAVIALLNSNVETTSRIRDIFIIIMALEFLVVGVALVVLMVQLATLINLLQNEIKPILTSTNETVSTLRGTVTFLSDNLAQPVIKLNEYMAGARAAMSIFRLKR
jgi:cytoskeletal protein RodZ